MPRILFCIYFLIFFLMRVHTKHNVDTNIEKHLEGKIVGGQVVDIKSYPFAVQLINMGKLCGGVIINTWTVITAAHCLAFSTNRHNMIIQAGARFTFDFKAQRYRVLTFVIHERYNKEQAFSYDIGLVFTEKPIKFSKKAKKAILINHKRWMHVKEKNFIVTGWGYTKHDGEVSTVGLQMTKLYYISRSKCTELLDGHKITADMFCLYGDAERDTCQGDSGGGVLWKGRLVGLTSHGDGCASKGKPSVYTNLWTLRKWIILHVNLFLEQYCNGNFREQDKITF